MRISQVTITEFKRFTDLTIRNLPETVKVVLIVGPNGSGKSSFFDALLDWYRSNAFGYEDSDSLYFSKNGKQGGQQLHKVGVNFYGDALNKQGLKGKFYFRTAYRNSADFTISNLSNQRDPTQGLRFNNLIQNDTVVEENYQRLISLTLKGVYDENNNQKTVEQLRDELIGKIRISLSNVFEDLNLSSIGDPLRNGSFYFEKGISKDFHYKNLSGGEKSAFDILLDLIIKSSYYEDAIYCIDEPETHMHTRLQSLLFSEIYNLIPGNSQLWVNTHSLGMLKKARELEVLFPGTIAFLNFDNLDFDKKCIIEPTAIDKTIWEKFIELTLDDYSKLIAPKQIFICEGDRKGRKYKNFDAQIFSKIFQPQFPENSFVSAGGSNEVADLNNPSVQMLQDVLQNTVIIRVTDRDDKSEDEIQELLKSGIKVLSRRHIESYLLDDELLVKLCVTTKNEAHIDEVLAAKQQRIENSIQRGNPTDDIKSASGDIYVDTKRILNLTQCGNTKDAFMRDTICPLITNDTKVFSDLYNEIFN
jgi:predicted ATPase